jgi:hypothetical protein
MMGWLKETLQTGHTPIQLLIVVENTSVKKI